jgi:hypothetical protein
VSGGLIAVWLDDERPRPPGYDVHARTAAEAIRLIESGRVARISLDHDLGPAEAGTGYDVAAAIERLAFEGKIPPMEVAIHTANPVGRSRMAEALRNAQRYWAEWQAELRELEQMMPPRDKLIEWARDHPPPQSWFDEDLDGLFDGPG